MTHIALILLPFVSDKIVRKLGIKIKPFKEAINIVDASGNNLSLLGSAVLFIQTQVLRFRIEMT